MHREFFWLKDDMQRPSKAVRDVCKRPGYMKDLFL